MDQKQPTNDEIIKMDFEDKQASQDFKITTMEDDLKRVADEKEEREEPLKINRETSSNKKEPISTPPPPYEAAIPIPPPPSPAPPNIPDFLLEDEVSNGGKMKSFLIGFGVVFIVGLLGFGGWWYYATRQGGQTLPAPPTPPTGETPKTPSDTPLISVDRSIKLEVEANETSKQFLSKLSSLMRGTQKGIAPKSIVRIIPTTQKKILTLDELSNITRIEIPPFVSRETFTLVAYTQNEHPVWGIILKTTSDEAKTEMIQKEPTLPGILQGLYADYTNELLPKGQSETFLDNNFEGTAIRYMNFDTPQRALDYAFFNNLLVFAGSREAMFALIERAKLRQTENTPSAP